MGKDKGLIKNKGLFYYGIKSIQIIFQAEPKRQVLKCLFAFLHGLSWTLQVVFTQRFFDAVQNLILKKANMTDCVIALILLIAFHTFAQVMNGIDNCYVGIMDLAVARHIGQNIFKRIERLDCIEFEDTSRLL